ncbi:MAG: DUF2934 domain-containing protein [Acidobacteria bacterium]|nr:DUF2934 domain-containing protein [Acidobacteriota bacterium]
MSATKKRAAMDRKPPVEPISTPENAPRPRLVTRSRKKRASPETDEAPDVMSVIEHVRVRAYYLSLERDGFTDPVGDWLRAERELIAGGARATARG